MTELYLILDDEPLDRRSIILVETEEQAIAITKNEQYMSYQKVETLSERDVKDMVCDNRYSKMDNVLEFYDAHCEDCNVKYNEDCPYL